MSDLNWCTYCDNAIERFSDALYCSDACFRADALNRHPFLGCDYAELRNFPRRNHCQSSGQSVPRTPPSTPLSSPPMTPSDSRLSHHGHFSFPCNNKISPPVFTLTDYAPKPSLSTTRF